MPGNAHTIDPTGSVLDDQPFHDGAAAVLARGMGPTARPAPGCPLRYPADQSMPLPRCAARTLKCFPLQRCLSGYASPAKYVSAAVPLVLLPAARAIPALAVPGLITVALAALALYPWTRTTHRMPSYVKPTVGRLKSQ